MRQGWLEDYPPSSLKPDLAFSFLPVLNEAGGIFQVTLVPVTLAAFDLD